MWASHLNFPIPAGQGNFFFCPYYNSLYDFKYIYSFYHFTNSQMTIKDLRHLRQFSINIKS